MMDRREFVRRLSAGMGAALTPSMLAAIVSGCKAQTESSGLLPTGELQVLESLAEAIIPTTDTPGAIGAGVPHYIEMMLAEFTPPDRVAVFRSQLDWVSSWLARNDTGNLEDLVAALDDQAFGGGTAEDVPPGEPALFATLKPLTVAGYYTSEVGALQELHQSPFVEYEDVPFAEIGKTWA
jgi:hypothetical protein